MHDPMILGKLQNNLKDKQADLDAYQSLPIEDQDEEILSKKVSLRNHAQVCRDHPRGCPHRYERSH